MPLGGYIKALAPWCLSSPIQGQLRLPTEKATTLTTWPLEMLD